ncbi:UNVERIFIED_CONTAM: hypothetical protein RMT77_011950 [Armadillidium vulgare]
MIYQNNKNENLVGKREKVVEREVVNFPPGFGVHNPQEGCQCWNTVDDSFSPEKECICTGNEVTQIPKSLANDVQRLTFSRTLIKYLQKEDFEYFSKTLQEL